ncbi:AMP-binding protein [Streptomyces erythrochromogenes]|uniref:AMP-binding protein n=1 Tax=Streptomyces erythrochromogenes TaxID=285574 RepID=UPI0038698251|nr:AMP-binding protein [Streptomyces erythrochromogenes]
MDLSTLLAHHLGARGGQPALESGARTWSYADLDRVTRDRAAQLRRLHPQAVRVALAGEHTAEALVWALAVMRAGLVYTPVNPGLPPERMREAMLVARPDLVLCCTPGAMREQDIGRRVVTMDEQAGEPSAEPGERPASWPVHEVAYSVFTSGSSGLPKLVNVGHRGIEALCRAQAHLFGIEAGHRVIQFSSLAFDASIAELLVTLYAGGTLVVPEWDGGSWVNAVGRYLAEHGCDVITVPPSVYARLGDEARKAIGTVVFAGEALSEVEFRAAARFSRVLNAYGPTEGTVCFSVAEPHRFTTSVGRPIDGYEALVRDRERNAYAPAGRGELVIVGDGVALGYEGLEPTDGPFTTVDGTTAYHTGDEVELRDGEVFYLGRLDDQIKRLGHRIALSDMEGRLSRLLGSRVAVLTQGDSLVLAHSATDRPEPELKTWLRELLPNWEVPDVLLSVPEIPVTHTGKADKDALRALAQHAGGGAPPEAPDRATAQTVVSDLVEETLGTRIAPDTSFFDAGGDSFGLVQLQVKLARLYGEEHVQKAFDLLNYDFTVAGFLAALGDRPQPAESPVPSVYRTVSAELAELPATLGALRREADSDPRAVTVTGAGGFIGGHVLNRLLGTGRPLTVVTTSNPRRLVERLSTRFGRPQADFADVRFLTYGDLEAAAGDAGGWGAVVHCGYEVNHVLPLERQLKGSVAATRSLVRAAAERGAHRFVFVSAASVGQEFLPFTEDTLAAVGDPYSQSKCVAEAYVEALDGDTCRVGLLRVGLVYGHAPGDAAFLDDDVFANLLRISKAQGVLPRLTGLVPVCHVADIADSVLAAATGAAQEQRSVLVQRTYGIDELRAELGDVRLVSPQEWLTTVTEAGTADTRVLAALRLWLNEPGWTEPVRTTCRPIIRELTHTLEI